MLKFFRKIRQRLLTENRFSKYLLYAVGEIVLVVIGILIALNINNWNEQNKLDKLESKILKEIHNNLTLDLKEIRSDMKGMDDNNKACIALKDHLSKHIQSTDSMEILAAILRVTPHFDPNKAGYGLLQSKGLEIITNDSLRNSISLIYERSYTYYKRYEEERIRFHALHSEPRLLEYFMMDHDIERENSYHGLFFDISPEDYQKLRTDKTFLKLISAISFENKVIQIRALRIEKNILSLMEEIAEELKLKENWVPPK